MAATASDASPGRSPGHQDLASSVDAFAPKEPQRQSPDMSDTAISPPSNDEMSGALENGDVNLPSSSNEHEIEDLLAQANAAFIEGANQDAFERNASNDLVFQQNADGEANGNFIPSDQDLDQLLQSIQNSENLQNGSDGFGHDFQFDPPADISNEVPQDNFTFNFDAPLDREALDGDIGNDPEHDPDSGYGDGEDDLLPIDDKMEMDVDDGANGDQPPALGGYSPVDYEQTATTPREGSAASGQSLEIDQPSDHEGSDKVDRMDLNGYLQRYEDEETHSVGSIAGYGEDAHSFLSGSPAEVVDHKNEEAEQHSMELRVGPRSAPNGYGPTYMDKDNSGDYDPSTKRRTVQATPAKRKRYTSPASRDRKRKIKKAYGSRSALALRQSGASYCICLEITSARGLELLGQYAGSNNWPEDHDIFSTLEVPLNNDGYALRDRKLDGEEEYKVEDFIGRPEAQGCKQCYQLDQRCSMRDVVGAYPCDACIEEGEGQTCEPLLPPKHKRACENCQASKMPCSYVQDKEGHSNPCTGCQSRGFKCIAGPATDPLRTRIGDDGKPTSHSGIHDAINSVTYERHHKTCAPCRRTYGWCSLRTSNDLPPCQKCKDSGTPCTFENVHSGARPGNSKPRSVRKEEREKKIAAEDARPDPLKLNREQLLQAERNRAAGQGGYPKNGQEQRNELDPRRGTVTTIWTALSHPITFNAPRDDPTAPCNWCAGNPFYPIMGHYPGLRQVRVIAWANGAGYEELHGGFTGDGGQQPSRMCGTCTFDRVRMMFCRTHLWQPIQTIMPALEGAADPNLQWQKAEAELEQQQAVIADERSRGQKPKALMRGLKSTVDSEGKPKSSDVLKAQLHRWCAICPSPAAHECCAATTGPTSAITSSADPPSSSNGTTGKRGCGLRLCKICYRLLTSHYYRGGDFRKFIKEIGDKAPKSHYPRGLRADYTFLDGNNGLLMKQVLHGKSGKTRPMQNGL